MADKIPTLILLISLMFYPFAAFGHIIYLFPQMLLVALGFFIIVSNKQALKKIVGWRASYIIIGWLISLASATAVESLSEGSNYLMPIKIFINGMTVIVVYLSGMELSFELLRKGLIFIVLIVMFISIGLYTVNLVDLNQIGLMILSGSQLSSSDLYGFASPLEKMFVTKNVSAMFIATIYSIYLYSLKADGLRLRLQFFIIFLVCSLCFFSRQGLLAIFVLSFLYLYLTASDNLKLILILSSIVFLYALGSFLFDVNSDADGAGERLVLWRYFFDSVENFILTGMGLYGLNSHLEAKIGIDNFHMFFMNQIGVYGIVHFIAFTFFCIASFGPIKNFRLSIFLIVGYYINVVFQTYGYEFGNMIVFVVALAKRKAYNGLS